MLLDPFEEQLHLPTAPVQLGDRQRRQEEIVVRQQNLWVSGGSGSLPST
mgnify:CR=1 FL=1